jgi:hypothetical protein
MKTSYSNTDPETLAGNELMAKYIGGIKYIPSWEKRAGLNRACWVIPTTSEYVYEPVLPESLHFHDSWDWILPVWILWLHEYINNPICKSETYLAVKEAILSGNIKAVWKALKEELELQRARLN